MRLTIKFALLMLIPIASMVVSGVLCFLQLKELAAYHVDQQSMLLMRMMNAVKKYTQDDALPSVKAFANKHTSQPNSDVFKGDHSAKESTREHAKNNRSVTIHEDKDSAFILEMVPSFAARKVLIYMTDNESEINKPLDIDLRQYNYRELSKSPTLASDLAREAHELRIIQDLERNPREIIDSDKTPGASSDPEGRKYLARAISIDNSAKPKCLACHGSKDNAPLDMQRLYKSNEENHGYDWDDKLKIWNDVAAAQVVYVPKQHAERLASQAIQRVAIWLLLSALITVTLLWWGVNVLVIRPVRRLSDRAEEISMNRLSSRLIPVRGTDEMAQLTEAFNRMITSLYKLIQRLKQNSGDHGG